jgi:heavy metal sensor kinase
MNPRSLAFRLGAWYTLLLSITFALVSAATFYGLQHYLRGTLRDSLKRRSGQIEQLLKALPEDASAGLIGREIEDRLAPEVNNRFVRITRGSGTLIYRSGAPYDHSFDPSTVPYRSSSMPVQAAAPVVAILTDQHLMIGTTPVSAPSGTYQLEVGVSIDSIEAALDRLLAALGLLLPALIACAAAGGYLLVSWALRPVDQLSQTAERMSVQDLALRLPVMRSGDALERLTSAFNTLLGRLSASVQTSRRYLADASHEVRTPLTIIKGELQELLAGEVSLTNNELREHIGSVLEEVARLEHLVSGLLVLSRLDAGVTQHDWVTVDLAELALSTAEQMRLLAEDRGIGMELSGLKKAEIQGDRARLKQVIVNLLDNAIRFTPRGGGVTLRTFGTDSGCILELSDTGVGIPAGAIPHVFDRFFRVDEARSREDGGVGLGLSIVKSICAMHGAQIEVHSQVARGSTFRVKFPGPP